jgi:hypothetical protein
MAYSQSTIDAMSLDERRRRRINLGLPKDYRPHMKCGRFAIQSTVDDDTFAQLQKFCADENVKMAEAIRLLIEWGLEANAS